MDLAAKARCAKAWYEKNRENQQQKARARMARYRDLNIRLRRLVLSAQPCVGCGEPPDPDTPFEFDHREGMKDGSRRVSDLVTSATSHHAFMRELPKCDIVCPTCHKKRTYDRQQWKRA